MEEQQMHTLAVERAESKIRFYVHLVVFLLVNLLLIIINLKTSPGSLWFLWPFAGWGIAIVIHGLKVLDVFNFSAAKKRLVEKELAKEKYKKQMEEDG